MLADVAVVSDFISKKLESPVTEEIELLMLVDAVEVAAVVVRLVLAPAENAAGGGGMTLLSSPRKFCVLGAESCG